MNYGRKSENKPENEKKIASMRSEISVNVIQYNKIIDDVMQNIATAMQKSHAMLQQFGNQRELLARSRMNERILNSSLKMLSGNRMQLWMINDGEIEEGLK